MSSLGNRKRKKIVDKYLKITRGQDVRRQLVDEALDRRPNVTGKRTNLRGQRTQAAGGQVVNLVDNDASLRQMDDDYTAKYSAVNPATQTPVQNQLEGITAEPNSGENEISSGLQSDEDVFYEAEAELEDGARAAAAQLAREEYANERGIMASTDVEYSNAASAALYALENGPKRRRLHDLDHYETMSRLNTEATAREMERPAITHNSIDVTEPRRYPLVSRAQVMDSNNETSVALMTPEPEFVPSAETHARMANNVALTLNDQNNYHRRQIVATINPTVRIPAPSTLEPPPQPMLQAEPRVDPDYDPSNQFRPVPNAVTQAELVQHIQEVVAIEQHNAALPMPMPEVINALVAAPDRSVQILATNSTAIDRPNIQQMIPALVEAVSAPSREIAVHSAIGSVLATKYTAERIMTLALARGFTSANSIFMSQLQHLLTDIDAFEDSTDPGIINTPNLIAFEAWGQSIIRAATTEMDQSLTISTGQTTSTALANVATANREAASELVSSLQLAIQSAQNNILTDNEQNRQVSLRQSHAMEVFMHGLQNERALAESAAGSHFMLSAQLQQDLAASTAENIRAVVLSAQDSNRQLMEVNLDTNRELALQNNNALALNNQIAMTNTRAAETVMQGMQEHLTEMTAVNQNSIRQSGLQSDRLADTLNSRTMEIHDRMTIANHNAAHLSGLQAERMADTLNSRTMELHDRMRTGEMQNNQQVGMLADTLNNRTMEMQDRMRTNELDAQNRYAAMEDAAIADRNRLFAMLNGNQQAIQGLGNLMQAAENGRAAPPQVYRVAQETIAQAGIPPQEMLKMLTSAMNIVKKEDRIIAAKKRSAAQLMAAHRGHARRTVASLQSTNQYRQSEMYGRQLQAAGLSVPKSLARVTHKPMMRSVY
jgi:hypothetical protein